MGRPLPAPAGAARCRGLSRRPAPPPVAPRIAGLTRNSAISSATNKVANPAISFREIAGRLGLVDLGSPVLLRHARQPLQQLKHQEFTHLSFLFGAQDDDVFGRWFYE
jgi:hypothetical protein